MALPTTSYMNVSVAIHLPRIVACHYTSVINGVLRRYTIRLAVLVLHQVYKHQVVTLECGRSGSGGGFFGRPNALRPSGVLGPPRVVRAVGRAMRSADGLKTDGM